MHPLWRRVTAATVLAVTVSTVPAAAALVVNMTPQSWSGETNQDSEPTLAIDPGDYSRMAGSAFTWDNLTGAPMTTATAPIYVSVDHGVTWTLAFIVPSAIGSAFPTGDITLSFGSTRSGALLHETSWLYGGILRATTSGRPMTVLRSQDFLDTATVMTTLDTQTGYVDQPHARALSAIGGNGIDQDKLYVGFNNDYSCAAPGGRSATLDVSQSAAAAVPTLSLDLVEARNTACQDGPSIVPAPHLDGTVYAAFFQDVVYGSPRLVVVRDDGWGGGTSPFAALSDPSDTIAGRFVTMPLFLQSGIMAQNRLAGGNVSIAVDPRNSDRVYVAYGDGGVNSETIHVQRSTDRGQTWSPDLLTVTSAVNPEIAINVLGTVGVLYQRANFNSNRWETHLTRTVDTDATVFDNPGVLLANTNSAVPSRTFHPYIGDYASLVAAGKNFFGIFSASNYPDTANFPVGVQFQRYADWGTHKLYADAAHTTLVPISIDPYFFEVDALSADQDFYVRDWTTDSTHADNGAEPSTNPVFYATADVWNRRSPTPGPFPSDQPTNEDAGNGTGSIGDNWAFARVRRNSIGASTAVTAHFLVSKFGTGSNFVDSTVGDPDVSFPDPDPVIITGGGTGPWLTVPYHWHLNAIAGNHLCLAVEISAPGSPYLPPSLVGYTPGWPTTDLRIVNDNHKAQRNMQLSTMAAGSRGSVTAYAIVHNAALFARDVPLRIGVSAASARYVLSATVRSISPDSRQEIGGPGQTLVVRGLQPGENRWVAITVQTVGLPTGEAAYLTADELAGGTTLSGFGVGLRAAPLASAMGDSLAVYRGVATRLAASFGVKASSGDANLKIDTGPAAYVAFVHGRLVPHLKSDLAQIGALGDADLFGLNGSLFAAATRASAPELVDDVTTLLNGVDARLTMLQLQHGDPADIVQMVRWQKQLFQQKPKLAKLECASKVVDVSTEFLRGRESRRLTNNAYPQLLREVGQCLREAAGARGNFTGSDLAELENVHRAYLLALSK